MVVSLEPRAKVVALLVPHQTGGRIPLGRAGSVDGFGAVECHLPTHCSIKLETPTYLKSTLPF